jgi:hypothetical protein
VARPTKYTPERVEQICFALSAGNTRRAAAISSGIGENTLGDWLRRFRDFRDAVEKAEASAELAHVGNIVRAAAEGNWTASAWWLERRRAAEWRRRDHVDHEVSGTIEHVQLDTAQRLLRVIGGSDQRAG